MDVWTRDPPSLLLLQMKKKRLRRRRRLSNTPPFPALATSFSEITAGELPLSCNVSFL